MQYSLSDWPYSGQSNRHQVRLVFPFIFNQVGCLLLQVLKPYQGVNFPYQHLSVDITKLFQKALMLLKEWGTYNFKCCTWNINIKAAEMSLRLLPNAWTAIDEEIWDGLILDGLFLWTHWLSHSVPDGKISEWFDWIVLEWKLYYFILLVETKLQTTERACLFKQLPAGMDRKRTIVLRQVIGLSATATAIKGKLCTLLRTNVLPILAQYVL